MSESLTELWNRGHADGLARRRDDEIYALDTQDARMYRDGHRMGRRQLEAPPPEFIINPENEPQVPSNPPARPADPAPDHASAFSDPIPGKHKTKRAKPVDPDQSSFL